MSQDTFPLRHDFDVQANEDAEHTHRLYGELRGRCPVAHTESLGGFWALLRYDDVAAAAGDPATFTTTVQNVIPKVAFTGRRPPLHLDPPEHTPYRAALNPLLSAERVAMLEPELRRIVRAALQPLLQRGHGDLCREFSANYPVQIFGRWANLNEALQAQLMTAGPSFIQAVQAFDTSQMRDTSLVLYDMARALIAERKARPLDTAIDPVSALLATRHDGKALPDELIVGTVRQVLVVGIVAPMIMTGAVGIHLARDKILQRKLRQDMTLIPAAVEEFLRLYSPYRGFARTPTRDVLIGGRTIARGEAIALTYASANRDESMFDSPDEFRLNRPNIGSHLAFGRGPHYCAGAHLARLELRVAIEELLRGTQDFDIAGPVLYTPYPEIGPWSVPLKFVAEAN